MYGIENLKNALLTLITVGEEVDKALSDDGKIDIWEGASIAFKAIGLVRVINNSTAIKNEFNDLDASERLELINYVSEELDLSNDVLEEKIERIFALLIQLSDLLGELK